jgi:hypothetical protein
MSRQPVNGQQNGALIMDIKKQYGTSETLEQSGVWVDMGDGASVLVARSGNPDNSRLIKRLLAPHKVALRNGKLADDVAERITIEAMAETILLDWKGIEEDGKPVKYSRDAAIRLLTDYKDFRDQVAAFSTELALFQQQDEAAALKN